MYLELRPCKCVIFSSGRDVTPEHCVTFFCHFSNDIHIVIIVFCHAILYLFMQLYIYSVIYSLLIP